MNATSFLIGSALVAMSCSMVALAQEEDSGDVLQKAKKLMDFNPVRKWTSADRKRSFSGRIVSVESNQVTIEPLKPGTEDEFGEGKTFAAGFLSPSDRTWVKENRAMVGISPEQRTKAMTVALMPAWEKKDNALVGALIQAGADVTIRNGDNVSFFRLLETLGDKELVEKVASCLPKTDGYPAVSLASAVKSLVQRQADLKKIIARGGYNAVRLENKDGKSQLTAKKDAFTPEMIQEYGKGALVASDLMQQAVDMLRDASVQELADLWKTNKMTQFYPWAQDILFAGTDPSEIVSRIRSMAWYSPEQDAAVAEMAASFVKRWTALMELAGKQGEKEPSAEELKKMKEMGDQVEADAIRLALAAKLLPLYKENPQWKKAFAALEEAGKVLAKPRNEEANQFFHQDDPEIRKLDEKLGNLPLQR